MHRARWQAVQQHCLHRGTRSNAASQLFLCASTSNLSMPPHMQVTATAEATLYTPTPHTQHISCNAANYPLQHHPVATNPTSRSCGCHLCLAPCAQANGKHEPPFTTSWPRQVPRSANCAKRDIRHLHLAAVHNCIHCINDQAHRWQ